MRFAGGDVALVREELVRRELHLADAIADLRRAFLELAAGAASTRPRVRVEGRERGRAWLHTLRAGLGSPAVVGGKDYASLGFDVPSAWATVIDARTAVPLAWIEAVHLGRVRTAAAAALATDLLAPADATTLVHFGAGAISELLVRGVLLVRPSIREVVLVRRAPEAPPWLADLGAAHGRLARSPDDARGATIATTATSSRTPVFTAHPALAGVHHVNLVGANHPARREIDDETARTFLPARGGALAVEDREQTAQEDGDFRPLVERGELRWADVPTLGDLLADPAALEGARSGSRTAFESVGIGLLDLAVAAGLCARLGLSPGA